VEFDWDEGNRDKNLKHGVHDWEIEEAFEDPRHVSMAARRYTAERRRTMLGRSATSGRYLAIVYTVRVESDRVLYRPISAVEMTPAQRAHYSRKR
jgi:uncharacterized DUF497 family protein